MLSEIQKNNLAKLLTDYSFQHLRPPPEIYEINYNESQHFQPTTTNDKRRRIFYKVKYQLEEQQAIEQTKQQLKKQGLTKYKIADQVILKHIYGGNWDIDKIIERLRQVIDYNLSEKATTFNAQTIAKLTNGQIYTYGHDKNFRPNIIMRVDKFDLNLPIEQHFNAVYFLMLIVLGYRMVPYHAEKYNLIMDLNNISLTNIPYRYLYNALEKIGVFYCGNSQKTFVFNAEGISHIWGFISFFLPESQKRRIIFLPKGSQSKTLEYIDQYELQKQYGGKLPNLTQFWPPKSTNEQFDVKMNQTFSHSEFFSVNNDEEYFQVEADIQTQQFCSEGNCHCNIF